jgi:PhzF family phenazine biosynthesis protein
MPTENYHATFSSTSTTRTISDQTDFFTMATKKLVERITARVFCHGPGGGNPVTVFRSQEPLSESIQEKLAKQCAWESVMVATPPEELPSMSFYMPSGQEVSFCAHAAIGGARVVSTKEEFSFSTRMDRQVHVVNLPESSSDACLYMRAKFEEAKVSHPPALQRILREHIIGLSNNHLMRTARGQPTFVNASIARPKTMVYVNDLKALRECKAPAPRVGIRTSFETACAALDDSTGIYVYSSLEEPGSWECRQFPRASGYPEDPATGIAAAALAASIYQQGVRLPCYKMYQGMSMGRPSLIQIQELEIDHGKNAYFGIQGSVEIDERDEMEVEEE